MDKFKEQLMINALTNDPMSVTFESIDNFFRYLAWVEYVTYKSLLLDILIHSHINNNYTEVLKDYISNKILQITEL